MKENEIKYIRSMLNRKSIVELKVILDICKEKSTMNIEGSVSEWYIREKLVEKELINRIDYMFNVGVPKKNNYGKE